jgi:hypothetical protein
MGKNGSKLIWKKKKDAAINLRDIFENFYNTVYKNILSGDITEEQMINRCLMNKSEEDVNPFFVCVYEKSKDKEKTDKERFGVGIVLKHLYERLTDSVVDENDDSTFKLFFKCKDNTMLNNVYKENVDTSIVYKPILMDTGIICYISHGQHFILQDLDTLFVLDEANTRMISEIDMVHDLEFVQNVNTVSRTHCNTKGIVYEKIYSLYKDGRTLESKNMTTRFKQKTEREKKKRLVNDLLKGLNWIELNNLMLSLNIHT